MLLLVFSVIILGVLVTAYDEGSPSPTAEEGDADYEEEGWEYEDGATGSLDECGIDDMEVRIRSPGGSESGWFNLDYETTLDGCGEYYEDDHGEDIAQHTEWARDNAYDYCPVEGDYDMKVRAELDGIEESVPVESDWYDSYEVNYHNQEWCECKDDTGVGETEWIGGYTNKPTGEEYDDRDLGCCMDDLIFDTVNNETDTACVYGEAVEEDVASTDDSLLVDDGEIFHCYDHDGGQDTPYDFVETRYECNYRPTDTGTYYCGVSGSANAETWSSLEESGCDQVVKRMRGGRIIIN